MPPDVRRDRRPLLAVAIAVVAALILTPLVVTVIRHSDAASTVSLVARAAPPKPPGGPLPAVVHTRWSEASPKAAVQGGTVVVANGSGVSGRDPLSGAERWAYRRGNAHLCDWTLRDGVVVTVFGKSHGCRDITALDAGTGQRRWYRSADLGTAVDLSSAAGVVVARSGDQLLAVDTATGLNRWTASKPGCRYGPVTVGGLGAVAVVRCGDRTQVVSHDPYADNQRWSVTAPGRDPVVLAVTDQNAAVLAGGTERTLTVYDSAGHRVGSLADRRLSGPAGEWRSGVEVGGVLLLWTGQRIVAVDAAVPAVRWATAADGPPALDGEQVLFPAAGNAVECSPATGRVLRRAAVAADLPRGATLLRAGRLIVTYGAGRTAILG